MSPKARVPPSCNLILLLVIWLGAFAVVGCQLGWMTRPLVGSPNIAVEFLRKRFRVEGRLLARLNHPRIVRVYDMDVTLENVLIGSGGADVPTLATGEESAEGRRGRVRRLISCSIASPIRYHSGSMIQ